MQRFLAQGIPLLKVLDDEGPDWKTLKSCFKSEGATVKILSHNWLSMIDHINELLAAAFCRDLVSYTHQPNPLWYLEA